MLEDGSGLRCSREDSVMGRHSGAWLLALLLLTGSAPAQTVVPITSEPDHHLVISNDNVRVFKVEVPPKADTLYHQHDYDYLYVAIGDADVTSTRLHEKPVEVKLKDGEVELSKAPFAHKATNNSDQPFRNVTIEILGGIGRPICGLAGGNESCGVGPGWAGGTSDRAFDMSAAPLLKSSRIVAADVLMHGEMQIDLSQIANGPYLLVPVSELKLTGSSRNSTRDISAVAGDPVWIPDSRPAFTNSGASARFILISFSPEKMQ
jgi:hypothetical protein